MKSVLQLDSWYKTCAAGGLGACVLCERYIAWLTLVVSAGGELAGFKSLRTLHRLVDAVVSRDWR
jgi:hypothetical protein